MSVISKVYEDYFKKSRLDEYKRVLELARDSGYRMVGLKEYSHLLKTNDYSDKKILLVRHDIDTSPKVARKIFEIEKQIYNTFGNSTFYFRWTTLDKELIKDIETFGYETGYHYEELATYAKRNHIKSSREIMKALSEIRRDFLVGLENYRKATGTESRTVASHGDFVNTKLGVQNYVLLEDDETRVNAEIEIEAYDSSIMHFINARFADHILLNQFSNKVEESIKKSIPSIMLLIHPRNWEVDIVDNTKENLRRLMQGINYRRG